MRKIKKIINKVSKSYKEYFRNYLLTNIGLILLTLYYLIFNSFYLNGDTPERILIYFISSSFFIESLLDKENKYRIYLYLISVLLSISLGLVNLSYVWQHLCYAGINLIFIVLGLFFIVRKENKISKYAVKVFYNLFKVFLFTDVLLIGFGIIYLIVDTLIIEGYDIEFYDKIICVIFGLYTAPFTIMSFTNTKEEVPELINVLIKRVLLILLDISFAVVIIYILKIVITTKIPQNQLFLAGFLLFIFAIPMFIMLDNYDGKLEKINYKYLPYLLIVTIGLQIYAIVVRVDTYGVTDFRYVGIFLIVFEIITLILYLVKDKKYIKFDLIVLAVMLFFLLIMPVTNAYEAPQILQVKRLESIWPVDKDESSITKTERQKIKDIYEFLNDQESPSKYLPSYLTMERINKYLMNTRAKFENKTNYYSYVYGESKIDVKGYSYIEEFVHHGGTSSIDNIRITLNKDEVYLKDIINKVIDNEDIDKLSIDNSNGDTLFITDISFYDNEESSIIESFTINGYLLHR